MNSSPGLSLASALFAGALTLGAGGASAQTTRLGDTFYPRPPDGGIRRFPAVAYDSGSDAYLVVSGMIDVAGRFVAADGTPLGEPTRINTSTGEASPGATRVACASEADACLVTWIEEVPPAIQGRLLRNDAGSVQFLGDPFVVNQNGLGKHTESAPSVTYAPAAREFLVVWSDVSAGGGPEVMAQRVSNLGALVGGEIVVTASADWEGFPVVAYNSSQNEYLVAYYCEAGGTSNVATQRVEAGTGALIGARAVLYGSPFDQYPEIAYSPLANRYLAITWHIGDEGWQLEGQLADGDAQPLGASLVLAPGGGGNGIGIAYNTVADAFLCVFQSQRSNEVWGVEVSADGVPGEQLEVTQSGTVLAAQPRVAAGSTAQWLVVATENYGQVMAQRVEAGGAAPAADAGPDDAGSPRDGGDVRDGGAPGLDAGLDAGSDGSHIPAPAPGAASGGCGCRHPGTPPRPIAMALVALVLIRRRSTKVRS